VPRPPEKPEWGEMKAMKTLSLTLILIV